MTPTPTPDVVAESQRVKGPPTFKGRRNIYVCDECCGHIVTMDVDAGTTPFMIQCEATVGCVGMMTSCFYRVAQTMRPDREWYKPKPSEIESLPAGYRDHAAKGGLILRSPVSDSLDTRVQYLTVAAPWAHPLWSYYLVSACHLREVEGLPAAVKYFPEATHELQIIALSPDDSETPLLPLNYVIQMAFPSDVPARRLCVKVVQAIESRHLNPDTDFIRRNAEQIERLARMEGAAIARTSWKRGEA